MGQSIARRVTAQGRGLLFGLTVLILGLGAAQAQDRRQNETGQFDFYVLALSWSPSFCEGAVGRSKSRSVQQQCGDRPYSFVVHGLWPQYEQGFPEYCQREAPRLNRGLISSMLDLMPSTSLIFHEWGRHGTCSGLSARAYFDTVRKARAAVKIPEQYLSLDDTLTVTPAEVEEAFLKANPDMTAQGISVACNGRRRLSEVRICVGKDLQFRDCGEVDRRACRADKVTMPPVRHGRAAELLDELAPPRN